MVSYSASVCADVLLYYEYICILRVTTYRRKTAADDSVILEFVAWYDSLLSNKEDVADRIMVWFCKKS